MTSSPDAPLPEAAPRAAAPVPELAAPARPRRLTRALARLRERFVGGGAAVWLPSLVVLGFVLWAFVSLHWVHFRPPVPMNPKDEGYISAFAMRMVEGRMLPYVDGVSHRGPMLYWVAGVAAWLGDHLSLLPIRVLALLASLLTVLFSFLAAARAGRPLAAGLSAVGIAFALTVAMWTGDGLAYNGEPLLNVFVLAALVALTLGLDLRRAAPSLGWTAAAGTLAACGALSKQVGAVVLVPFALWVAAAAFSRRPPGKGPWRPLLAFALGVATPVLVVLARYALAGHLRTFFFYAVTYNSAVYMAPHNAASVVEGYRYWAMSRPILVAAGLIVAVAGIARALAPIRRGAIFSTLDRNGFGLTVALGAFLSAAVANGTLRDFHHYYVQAVPWFALLLGLLAEEWIGLEAHSTLKKAGLGLLVLAPPTLLYLPMWTRKLDEYQAIQKSRSPTLPICDYVAQHSKEGDAMFVWGFAPDFHTFCRRKPASRYVYSTFPSGFVPFFVGATREDDEARVVPGSRELLIADLEESRPPLIIDVPFTIGGRSMKNIPVLAKYLETKYCAPTPYDSVEVFHRRAEDGTCPIQR